MDTREKLEQDVRQWLQSRLIGNEVYETIISWLERQAAITKRDTIDLCEGQAVLKVVDMRAKVGKLQAKVDELTEERDALLEQIQKYAEEAANFEQTLEDFGQTHMRLPVDVDGVPIRIGDTMERVCAEMPGTFIVGLIGADGHCMDDETSFFIASECRHVKPDTVESLLEEFHGKLWSDDEEQMALLEEYAERIRKAVE